MAAQFHKFTNHPGVVYFKQVNRVAINYTSKMSITHSKNLERFSVVLKILPNENEL